MPGALIELFADCMGIEVSKSLGQHYTETAGAAYEQLQEEEVERLEQGTSSLAGEQSAEKLQISADGATLAPDASAGVVPLLHGVWAEVKTLVIGEVKSVPGKDGEPITKTGNLTYFSRKTCSETFERLALVETHRRGIDNAKKVAAIMDGAEWLQGFTDYHCSHAGHAHFGLSPCSRACRCDWRSLAWRAYRRKSQLERNPPAPIEI